MSEWISVKDRLPDSRDTSVLIAKHGSIGHATYRGTFWNVCASNDFVSLQAVTHWMPLPKPPKDK